MKKYSKQFERKYREVSNESFICIRNDAEDRKALKELVRECHNGGNILPNDWIYKKVYETFLKLEDMEEEDIEYNIPEIVDGLCDTYNKDLFSWLDNNAIKYVDRAIEEGPTDTTKGLVHIIQCGQYQHVEEIVRNVFSFIMET